MRVLLVRLWALQVHLLEGKDPEQHTGLFPVQRFILRKRQDVELSNLLPIEMALPHHKFLTNNNQINSAERLRKAS